MASSWAFSRVATLGEVTRKKKKGQRVLASQAVWKKHRIGPEDSYFRSLMLPRTSYAALDSLFCLSDPPFPFLEKRLLSIFLDYRGSGEAMPRKVLVARPRQNYTVS